ncbi:L10-interacting MYB domain-containing protein isoform X2 [Neltuma alba]|nr:L10-interacting MYB domain-containing protein isoform X2 [Prosopis alba]XP_028781956.1 L10-interacting MYB domain-containing protein isoform X2 [Prosopis alba]
MGVEAQNSKERLRTIWTPEMDRYFIGLMLEQVGKGNKLDDHLFSKRAWKHMSAMFNAKFKSQYEKDVLKNRHKTLRNLYRTVTKLLAQTGFSWDEKRKMVTADNNVWDEYIKVHPDARSYRIKSIPYFSDLCTIYGRALTAEKGDDGATMAIQSNSVGEDTGEVFQDTKVAENLGVSIPENANDDFELSLSKACTRSRTYWQPPMDHYLINLMLAHVHKGNRVDGAFSKQAWMEMISSFNENFGFDHSVEILKNRYKTLRRQYNVIKSLLHLDGFVWDDARQMVTADDYLWQDYIKVHPDARQFMTRPVPYFKDLCVIYDPTFDEKESPRQDLDPQNSVADVSMEPSEIGLSPAASNYIEYHDGNVSDLTHTSEKHKRQLEIDSTCPKRLRDVEVGMASTLQEMATTVSSLSTKKSDDNSVPIEIVIEAVQALPDMDEDLVLDACDFLEDEKKARTFLALDVKLRKNWLLRKLRT